MHRHRNTGLDACVPERVELFNAHGATPAVTGHRRRPDQDGLGAALQTPLEFFECAIDAGQVDDRSGEDAVLVVELPGFVHPLVQRVDDVEDEVGIVLQSLLHQAGQRREHQRVVQAERVEDLEAGRGVTERRDGLHRLAHHLAEALAAATVPEVILLGTRPRDHLERRVGNVVADHVANHDLGAAADVDVIDDALAVLRQELGQRFLGLIEVVVGIEHRVRKMA